MKKILLALTMVALAASLVYGANTYMGGEDAAASTDPITVSWTGKGANYLNVIPETADVTVTMNPDHGADGSPIPVKAGTSLLITQEDIHGFTITRATSTAVQYYWGVR